MKFKNQKMNIQRKRRIPIKFKSKNQQVVEMSDWQQPPNDQYHSLEKSRINKQVMSNVIEFKNEAEVRILSQNEEEVE